MGFMFRLCFWLGVTVAIMPPDDRPVEALGGGSADSASLDQRLAETLHSAWTLVSQVSVACEENPELCAATAALVQTTAETGQTLAGSISAPTLAPMPARPRAGAPIDAPLPDPNHEGRVGLGEGPDA
jgi:hypothetical protein